MSAEASAEGERVSAEASAEGEKESAEGEKESAEGEKASAERVPVVFKRCQLLEGEKHPLITYRQSLCKLSWCNTTRQPLLLR